MSSKLSSVLLAQVVQRYRDGNYGVSDLSSLVEELADSDLSPQEIAERYQALLGDEEKD